MRTVPPGGELGGPRRGGALDQLPFLGVQGLLADGTSVAASAIRHRDALRRAAGPGPWG